MDSEPLNPGPARHAGLFDSVKTLGATLLAIAHTRLELLSTEIEEERERLTSMLTWMLVALFCGGFGMVLATLFFVFALWRTHPLLALGIPAILFLVGAASAWLVALGKAKAKPRLFAASLAELSKDRKGSRPRS